MDDHGTRITINDNANWTERRQGRVVCTIVQNIPVTRECSERNQIGESRVSIIIWL